MDTGKPIDGHTVKPDRSNGLQRLQLAKLTAPAVVSDRSGRLRFELPVGTLVGLLGTDPDSGGASIQVRIDGEQCRARGVLAVRARCAGCGGYLDEGYGDHETSCPGCNARRAAWERANGVTLEQIQQWTDGEGC